MAMTENEVLERLQAAFPGGVIYNEEYRKKLGGVTIDVRKLSRAAGQSSVQWLTVHGFTWKETGYIETDMLVRDVEIPAEPADAFALADGVFKRYPLAGEYVLTDGEAQMLYQSASQTVQKVLRGDTRVTVRENVVLVLETIELLKYWSNDLPEEGEEPVHFWDYIFLQYGFQTGRSDAARDRLYKHFCGAVRDTLSRYKRFFAPAGKTQRYYTTLLLHALAPRRSIEGLFNILFNFYVENLDFQYVPEDTSYKQFTKGMRARWNSSVAVQDDFQLRSDAVFSGLKALFNERPGYMAVLCDGIVEKMDALLREEEHKLDPARNGWDKLLAQWYQKKSSAERSRVQGERREKKTEFVATTAERIFVRYALEDSVVGLRVPCIRLQAEGDRRPLLRVFQNGAVIWQGELHVTGDSRYFCLTTKSRFLPLKDTNFDFNAPPRIRAEIIYLDNPLYTSGQKLERDYLIFDSSGNDRTVKTGRAFLFAGAASDVELSQETGVLQLNHPGQLLRLDLGETSSVAVDGREAFAGAEASAQFRRHTVPGPVRDLHGLDGGGELELFRGSFTLSLMLPQGENPLLYQLSLDGEHRSLKEFQGEDGALSIPSARSAGRVHSVRLVDIRAGLVRYEYRYAVLPDCVCRLDRGLYRSGVDEAGVLFSWEGRENRLTLPIPEGESAVSFSVPGLDFTLELDVPALHCTLLGKNAFQAPETLWHKDIPAGEFVRIRAPEGWSCRLMLGIRDIPAPDGLHYELGNELRAGRDFQETESLGLLLSKGQERLQLKLTEIAFVPRFLQPPLELEEDRLLWRGEGTFLGDSGGRFTLELDLPDGMRRFQTAPGEDRTLEEPFSCPDGRYAYRVLQKSGSVFASGTMKTLYRGDLLVGEADAFRFQDREIHVRNALCWDFDREALKSVEMRDGCGVLCGLTYVGAGHPPWEEVPMPHYTATLYFEDARGQRHPFNGNPHSKGYELVNPVHVWLVNDRLLILQCRDEDGSGVYIDTRYNTIVNRSLDGTVPRKVQLRILDTPDYFEYTATEAVEIFP